MTSRPIGLAANADFLDEWGCTYDEYLAFKSNPQNPIGAFVDQRSKARRRGIQFSLTFLQWWTIWQNSGHWSERGRKLGQYVMSRHGDAGPYAIGNVSIVTAVENTLEHLAVKASRKRDFATEARS